MSQLKKIVLFTPALDTGGGTLRRKAVTEHFAFALRVILEEIVGDVLCLASMQNRADVTTRFIIKETKKVHKRNISYGQLLKLNPSNSSHVFSASEVMLSIKNRLELEKVQSLLICIDESLAPKLIPHLKNYCDGNPVEELVGFEIKKGDVVVYTVDTQSLKKFPLPKPVPEAQVISIKKPV